MSSNYQAGVDTSDLVLSYGKEVTWGLLPAVQFQAVRVRGEGFSESKQRTRPAEIRADGQAAHGVTTQVEAQGSMDIAVSYGTYDDLLAGLLNGTWGTPLAIQSAIGDISAVAASSQLTSATADKFIDVAVGQWIKITGFVQAGNNGFFRVSAKPDNQTLTLADATLVDEVANGADVALRGTLLRNGIVVDMFYFQKQLAASLFLTYPGSYISSGNLTASLGGFFEGSLSFLCKNENKAIADSSTGAVLPAATGRVIDTVSGFEDLRLDDSPIQSVATEISLAITKENARAQYGLGSASAQGIGRGTLTVAGTLNVYFKDFSLYDAYKDEADHLVSFRALDDTGAGYIITLPTAVLTNPEIVAGGPDTDVMAEFDLEGNKDVTTSCTVQIDKFAALP